MRSITLYSFYSINNATATACVSETLREKNWRAAVIIAASVIDCGYST